MIALTVPHIVSAHGTGESSYGTAYADFLFYPCVDVAYQVGIFFGQRNVSLCLNAKVFLAVSRSFSRNFHTFGRVNPCALICALGIVVEYAGYTDKELCKLSECVGAETFAVPVNIVVAENNIEAVNLVGFQLFNGETVDLCEIIFRQFAG